MIWKNVERLLETGKRIITINPDDVKKGMATKSNNNDEKRKALKNTDNALNKLTNRSGYAKTETERRQKMTNFQNRGNK